MFKKEKLQKLILRQNSNGNLNGLLKKYILLSKKFGEWFSKFWLRFNFQTSRSRSRSAFYYKPQPQIGVWSILQNWHIFWKKVKYIFHTNLLLGGFFSILDTVKSYQKLVDTFKKPNVQSKCIKIQKKSRICKFGATFLRRIHCGYVQFLKVFTLLKNSTKMLKSVL